MKYVRNNYILKFKDANLSGCEFSGSIAVIVRSSEKGQIHFPKIIPTLKNEYEKLSLLPILFQYSNKKKTNMLY